MPGNHLPLEKIKLLAARVRILETMASAQLSATDAGYGNNFDLALGQALAKISQNPSPDEETLDDFLAKLTNLVRALDVPAFFDPKDEYTPGALRKALAVLPTKSCGCCQNAQALGHPCNGHAADDDAIIGDTGPCLEHIILKYFRAIRAEVERNYETYCTKKPDEKKPEPGGLIFPAVSLRTGHSQAPNTFGRARWVGGATEFKDADGKLTSFVDLALNANEVDLNSLRAIPYVLFHECACHAFSGLRIGAAERTRPERPCFDEVALEKAWNLTLDKPPPDPARPTTGAADLFAEGWMDFVAAELCSRVADGMGLTGDGPWLSPEQAEAGTQLHRARCDTEEPNITPWAKRTRNARRLGADAAAKFLSWLRLTFPSTEQAPDLGWDHFMRISLDLNVLRERVFRRQDFVKRVYEWLNSRNTKDLKAKVQRYLAGEPVTCLLAP